MTETVKENRVTQEAGGKGGAAEGPGKPAPLKASLICLEDSTLPDDQKGLVIPLAETVVTIGRGTANGAVLLSKRISRRHARAFFAQDGWYVEDLGSANGVFLNQDKVTTAQMRHGDILNLGAVPFRFEVAHPETTAEGSAAEDPRNSVMNQTLLCDDFEAAAAMLESPAEEAEALAAEPQAVRGLPETALKPHPETLSRHKPAPGAKGGRLARLMLKLTAFMLLAALCAGGIHYYLNIFRIRQVEQEIIEYYQRAIRQYTDSAEGDAKTFDERENSEAVKTLSDLIAQINFRYDAFPDVPELRALESTLLLLRLERKIRVPLLRREIGKGTFSLVTATRRRVQACAKRALESGGPASGHFAEVTGMIDLMEIVLRYKWFAQKHPDPDGSIDAGAMARLRIELDALNGIRDRYSTLKKHHFTALMVQHPYFAGIVKEVEDRTFTLVYKWHQRR